MYGGERYYKFKWSQEAPNSILELPAGRLAVKNHQGEKAAQYEADKTAPRIPYTVLGISTQESCQEIGRDSKSIEEHN